MTKNRNLGFMKTFLISSILRKIKNFLLPIKDDSENIIKLIIIANLLRNVIFWDIKNSKRNAKGTEKGTRVPTLEKERSRNAFLIF